MSSTSKNLQITIFSKISKIFEILIYLVINILMLLALVLSNFQQLIVYIFLISWNPGPFLTKRCFLITNILQKLSFGSCIRWCDRLMIRFMYIKVNVVISTKQEKKGEWYLSYIQVYWIPKVWISSTPRHSEALRW